MDRKKEKKRARAVAKTFETSYSTGLRITRELAEDAKAQAEREGCTVTDATIDLAMTRGLLQMPGPVDEGAEHMGAVEFPGGRRRVDAIHGFNKD